MKITQLQSKTRVQGNHLTSSVGNAHRVGNQWGWTATSTLIVNTTAWRPMSQCPPPSTATSTLIVNTMAWRPMSQCPPPSTATSTLIVNTWCGIQCHSVRHHQLWPLNTNRWSQLVRQGTHKCKLTIWATVTQVSGSPCALTKLGVKYTARQVLQTWVIFAGPMLTWAVHVALGRGGDKSVQSSHKLSLSSRQS